MQDPESFSEKEVTYFGDIMDRVAYDVELSDREELAHKLAEEKLAPSDLMYKLANDEISVAHPVIEKSPVLNEDQLVEIASRHSQMHLLAMTNRHDITENISSTLVEHGDDTVVESLAGNHAANISEETFHDISERSRMNENIQKPLATRPDLPAEVAQNMISFAQPEIVTHLMAKSVPDESSTNAGEPAQNDTENQRDKIEGLIEQFIPTERITEAKLVDFIRAGEMTQAVGAFAHLTELDVPTARRVLFDKSGRALAVACKAAKFDKTTYSSVILGIGKDSHRSIQETYQLVGLYDTLDLNTAKRIMRFWKVRKAASEDQGGSDKEAAPMPIPGLSNAV